MARLSKEEQAAVEEFGFEFSSPPERKVTRRSRHAARWEVAKRIAAKNPGRALKVLSYPQASSAYSQAKNVNNGVNKSFTEDYDNWKAVAAHDPSDENPDQYSVWLTYQPQEDGDEE